MGMGLMLQYIVSQTLPPLLLLLLLLLLQGAA
jgi:hypothetical protein